VWAIADGQVTFADSRGGNGNLVVLQHADGIESLYAHLSGFGEGIRRGHEVRQGEVIGYVGSTGLSTGPHLHLAVRVDGEFVDPLGLEASRGPRLEGEALASFRQATVELAAELDAIPIAPVDPSLFEPVPETGDDPDLASDFGIFDGDPEHDAEPDDE
jgi:murein DD-endopeptidase MepM/ murein hydrolase activator NlpD